jgi:MraZ protein
MIRFLGNMEARLDAKARVFVPATFRKILQSSGQSELILRKDIFQNCLVLYPLIVWEEELVRLRSRLSRWDKNQQHLFRRFVMDAERLEMDSNGRILIPQRCRQLTGIESEIRFLGVDNTIEIWTKEGLEQAVPSSTEDDFGAEIQRLMNDNL